MKKPKISISLIQLIIMLVITLSGFVSVWAVTKEKIHVLEEQVAADSITVISMGKDISAIKAQNEIILKILMDIKKGVI